VPRAVAKRRALFDDPAEEINEMTAIIKQSITHLSTEVSDLKARASTDGGTNQQSKQHSTGVINSLQQTLKNTTSEFMDVVKTRRQAVQDQQDTLSVYGASSKPLKSSVFAPAPPAGSGQTEREGPSYSSGGLGDTFESQSQLVSMQPQDYLQSRADDVEQVESTIRELGGIFGRLAEIVSEQGEMVQR
jgi:syntaxin 5